MKKFPRAASLVLATVCAVAVWRISHRGSHGGMPVAPVGTNHVQATVPSASSEVSGVVSRVSDGGKLQSLLCLNPEAAHPMTCA